MQYISSYRKYRPMKFDDVVGQKHIVQTLKNAIKNDKLAHAYLFNGPRGTGKTSIAKIFAREINCTCEEGNCIVCNLNPEEICPDIIEMDAASNNSVEEIRKIVDSVNFVPLDLKYKVYIIDEVHMLSKSAFNALLKTLEEPPKHVKFILATTEIHKIPLTIISRTQRFDFKKIDDLDIVSRLSEVLTKEEITYEEEALAKLAQLADGGLRDALSLLDKVVMYEEQVGLDNVISALNLVDEDYMNNLLQGLYNKQTVEVVTILDEINSSGVDQIKFIVDFQFHVRNILLDVIAMKNLDYNRNVLIDILKSLNDLQQRLMYTRNYRLLIEIYFIELASPQEKQNNIATLDTKNAKTLGEILGEKPVKNTQVETENVDVKKIYEPSKNEKSPETVIEPLFEPEQIHEEEQELEEMSEQVISEKVVQTKVDREPNPNAPQVILDVLIDATKQDKMQIMNLYPLLISSCYDSNQRGLAKFFESSKVTAASQNGCVFSIDSELLATFTKRKDAIADFLSEKLERHITVFLISEQEWLENRSNYAKSVKDMKNNDIYQKAVSIFGEDIVKKI